MHLLTRSISCNVRLNLFWMFGSLLVNSTVKLLSAGSELAIGHCLSPSSRFSLSRNEFVSLTSAEIDSSPSKSFTSETV